MDRREARREEDIGEEEEGEEDVRDGRGKRKREKKEKKRKKRERREKKEKDEGGRAFLRNRKRWGGWLQKGSGWERKKPEGNSRVWRLGGLGPVWDALSRLKILFSFCKYNLAI